MMCRWSLVIGVLGGMLGLGVSVMAEEVCLDKSTGRLLEYQSAGRIGTCTDNLKAAGISADTIQDKLVTVAEWQTIRDQWIVQPALAEQRDLETARRASAERIKTKLSLSEADWQELRKALR